MQLRLPHLPSRTPSPIRPEDRIPTVAELNRLYQLAREDLQNLDYLHAAEVAQYDRARAGVVSRMGNLIAACEAYYGTDLRKAGSIQPAP